MGYKHLTREQRYAIEALLQTPMSLREIGEVIGVSTGTVSREIRRLAGKEAASQIPRLSDSVRVL